MKFFYLSSVANSEGSHEVHHRDCELIPDSLNRDYLGPFNNGLEAIRKAEKNQSKSKFVRGLLQNHQPTSFL